MKSKEPKKLALEGMHPMFEALSDEQEETITGGARPTRFQDSDSWEGYSYSYSEFSQNTPGAVNVLHYTYTSTDPSGTYSEKGNNVYNFKTGNSVYHGKTNFAPA